MGNIIEVKNVFFEYEKGINVLRDVSFVIKENTYNVIVGNNGCGKSTIAKLLCGIETFTKGEIKVDNLQLNKDNLSEIRTKTGIIFQNPDNQFVANSVKDDIIFGLENYNIDPLKMDKIIDEVAKLTKIENLLDRDPSSLSGGEKQRAALAATIALKPKIIILDESSSMLDPVSKKELKDLIVALKEKEKMTIISITHDAEETLLADQVILIDQGRVAFSGKREDYFALDDSKINFPNIIKLQKELNFKELIGDEAKLIDKLKGEGK